MVAFDGLIIRCHHHLCYSGNDLSCAIHGYWKARPLLCSGDHSLVFAKYCIWHIRKPASSIKSSRRTCVKRCSCIKQNLIRNDPSVLKAFSPYFAGNYFVREGTTAWKSLGGVLLAFTGESIFRGHRPSNWDVADRVALLPGVEAMYANLGAFSKRQVFSFFALNEVEYPELTDRQGHSNILVVLGLPLSATGIHRPGSVYQQQSQCILQSLL
jgi:potassium transporter